MMDRLLDPHWWNEFLFPILFRPINSVFAPDPRYVLTFLFVGFVLACVFLKQLTHPVVVGAPAALFAVLFVIGLVNPDFQLLIFKGDNVPIVILLVVVPFYTWWGLRQAVLNDEYKHKAGRDLLRMSNTPDNDPEDKVHTFPFLVHPEFISTVVCSVLLMVWSITIDAPLEQPSESARTPNPSKAPWYFLGLQEMLVYFDPWLAGVVMPSYIIVGLMAIPYFDANPKGNGYFTWEERKYAISFFLFGFVILWVILIVNGTLLRGPGWNFFGPFEYWDHNKVEALTNVNFSEMLGFDPATPWWLREAPGFLALLIYFIGLPIVGWFVFRKIAAQYGVLRYGVASHFILAMMLLPIKMYLRWLFNLKYIIAIHEIGVNI